jgi:hypothetical protein
LGCRSPGPTEGLLGAFVQEERIIVTTKQFADICRVLVKASGSLPFAMAAQHRVSLFDCGQRLRTTAQEIAGGEPTGARPGPADRIAERLEGGARLLEGVVGLLVEAEGAQGIAAREEAECPVPGLLGQVGGGDQGIGERERLPRVDREVAFRGRFEVGEQCLSRKICQRRDEDSLPGSIVRRSQQTLDHFIEHFAGRLSG